METSLNRVTGLVESFKSSASRRVIPLTRPVREIACGKAFQCCHFFLPPERCSIPFRPLPAYASSYFPLPWRLPSPRSLGGIPGGGEPWASLPSHCGQPAATAGDVTNVSSSLGSSSELSGGRSHWGEARAPLPSCSRTNGRTNSTSRTRCAHAEPPRGVGRQ